MSSACSPAIVTTGGHRRHPAWSTNNSRTAHAIAVSPPEIRHHAGVAMTLLIQKTWLTSLN